MPAFGCVEAASAADIPAAPPPTIRMSVEILFTGHDLHSVGGEDRAASLVFLHVDRHPALEANAHAAQWATLFSGHRSSKRDFIGSEDRCGDGSAIFNRNILVIYGQRDQCSVNARDGEYGSGDIAGFRPMISSAISSAVPNEVVMPRPSWPAAM